MKELKMKACNNWILVERLPPEREEQVGSVFIRKSEKEAKQNMGIVVTVGKDCDNPIEPGDTVIWGDWDGPKVYVNKKEYTAIRNTDVILAG